MASSDWLEQPASPRRPVFWHRRDAKCAAPRASLINFTCHPLTVISSPTQRPASVLTVSFLGARDETLGCPRLPPSLPSALPFRLGAGPAGRLVQPRLHPSRRATPSQHPADARGVEPRRAGWRRGGPCLTDSLAPPARTCTLDAHSLWVGQRINAGPATILPGPPLPHPPRHHPCK